jgi:tripartite-type tricarboxylate transporter receptor subunit TctC
MGLITASTHGLAPVLGTQLPYDAVKDFKPVSMIGEAPYVLVIRPGIPAKTVAEFVAYAKARPGKLNYGSAGIASIGHLAAALLAQKTGIEITHVPYKSTAQSAIDLMAGRLDLQIATVAPTLPSIREGKMRALATTGSSRMTALPDVPTMVESGVNDYVVALWMAFVMPAAAPDPVVRRVNAEMTSALKESDTADALRKQGLEPEPGAPSLVTARIRAENETWRALIAKTGIKPE